MLNINKGFEYETQIRDYLIETKNWLGCGLILP